MSNNGIRNWNFANSGEDGIGIARKVFKEEIGKRLVQITSPNKSSKRTIHFYIFVMIINYKYFKFYSCKREDLLELGIK